MKVLFFHVSTALVGLGLLILEVSRSHSDTLHSVVPLWTSHRPVAETSTLQLTLKRQTSMKPAKFEPAIPASQRTVNIYIFLISALEVSVRSASRPG
jgi:hypothetical protein